MSEGGTRMRLYYDDQKELGPVFCDLWRTIFKDPEAYEVFYFQTIYPKNRVLALEKDDKIAGMIHLNPYDICVNGKKLSMHYIVGVATMEKYRRQGIMRRMLTRCMKDMADQGEVFTYLMPANRLYYEPFDFTIVQYFRTIHTPGTDAGGSKLSVLKPEEYERASDFVNAYCHNNFQVYTKFDPEYLKQLQKETESEQGEMLVWKKHDSICGFCCYGCDEETVYVRQIFCDDMDAMIREIKAKFSKKQLELTLCAEKEANGASIMVRILRLDLLMNRISAIKEAELRIQITDSVLESQNGTFRINFSPKGCSLERTDLSCVQTISIQDLTKILFGVDCENLLEKYPDFQLIKPLGPVMIGEII